MSWQTGQDLAVNTGFKVNYCFVCLKYSYFKDWLYFKAHFLDKKTIVSISCTNVGSEQEFGNLFKHSILKK